jgi:aminoglycoside 2'-N-acetyltransferase I
VADVRLFETEQLPAHLRAAIRRLLDEAFSGDFSQDDWEHALGGWHAIVASGSHVVAHAAVVERRIRVGAPAVRAGYVEAVAVAPARQRQGLGTSVMTSIAEVVRDRFDLGLLSTGEWHFYERVGWERWRGPSYVATADGRLLRSADDDDGLMVLRCAASHDVDLSASIVCDERPGDNW